MKNSSSFFMLYIAIFWLSYECTNGMPKMHGESSSNPGKMNSQKPNVSSIKGKKQVIMLMRKASWKSIRMNQKLKLGIRCLVCYLRPRITSFIELSIQKLIKIFKKVFHAKAEGKNPSKNKDKKTIGEQENFENIDQHPISKETRKWLKKFIEFIDKNNPKQFNGIEEKEQLNDEKELNEKKNELKEKLKKSDKEMVTREEVKQFFALLNNFLKDIETKMTTKLKTLKTYDSFRIEKTIENEIKTPKKQKEVAKLEKCICQNEKTNIENDDLDKIALEAIQLFKKLQILNCLATDKKQKEISEYFDTYYYQQKQKELKEEAEKPDYPIGHCSSCPEPGFATKAVCVCCKKLNEDESEACIFCCPCICAANITLCAASFASTAIDACYWCGYESYKAGSACLNKENKKKNKKKQEKIEKHLEEITPP